MLPRRTWSCKRWPTVSCLVLGAHSRKLLTLRPKNDVDTTESQSVNRRGGVKYSSNPQLILICEFAQITAVSPDRVISRPPGTRRPFWMAYNCIKVPILQARILSSDSLPESTVTLSANPMFAHSWRTIAGASIPFPYGGQKQRQVQGTSIPAMRANGVWGMMSSSPWRTNLICPRGNSN